MSDSLYEISTEIQALHFQRESAELDGNTELVEKLDGELKLYLQEKLPAKVDGVRGYIRAQENSEAVHKAEAELHHQMAKAARSNIERIKGYVLGVMQAAGAQKLTGALHWIRRQANGGVRAVEVRQPELLSPEYLKISVTLSVEQWAQVGAWLGKYNGGLDMWHQIIPQLKDPQPHSTAIRIALERGEGVPGCVLVERGEHVRCS